MGLDVKPYSLTYFTLPLLFLCATKIGRLFLNIHCSSRPKPGFSNVCSSRCTVLRFGKDRNDRRRAFVEHKSGSKPTLLCARFPIIFNTFLIAILLSGLLFDDREERANDIYTVSQKTSLTFSTVS